MKDLRNWATSCPGTRGTTAPRMSTMAKHEMTRCAKQVLQNHFPFVQIFEAPFISRETSRNMDWGRAREGPGTREPLRHRPEPRTHREQAYIYLKDASVVLPHLSTHLQSTTLAQNIVQEHHPNLPIHTTQTPCLSSSQESRPMARATRTKSG